ncbi:hypothetical protein [Moritella sp.]|nr:hypothetical protein [Moritella sp.]
MLTDLPGGTPCNRAVAEMVGDRNVKVISGANLSMLAGSEMLQLAD